MRARLLLAGMAFPAFSLTAQPSGRAAASGATPAARAGSAPLDPAHARLVSVGRKRFDAAPAKRSNAPVLESLRSSVILGVLDTDVGAAEEASLLARGFSPYPMPGRVARAKYTELGESTYFASRATDKPDASPSRRPTVGRESNCWWLWAFTGMPGCW